MFKQGGSSSRQKNDGCFSKVNKFYGKMSVVFALRQKNASVQKFYSEANRKTLCSSKNRY